MSEPKAAINSRPVGSAPRKVGDEVLEGVEEPYCSNESSPPNTKGRAPGTRPRPPVNSGGNMSDVADQSHLQYLQWAARQAAEALDPRAGSSHAHISPGICIVIQNGDGTQIDVTPQPPQIEGEAEDLSERAYERPELDP
jgi:hypothetical protein